MLGPVVGGTPQREEIQNSLLHPIYNAARSCLKEFEYKLDTTNKEGDNYLAIEDLMGQFNQWAAYVGAFAVPRASLDARLTPHPDIREMVLELLYMIQENLTWVNERDITEELSESSPGMPAVRAALDRLLILSVNIRRSARRNDHFREGSRNSQSLSLCLLLVQKRYPHARKSLCSQLGASIHVRGISLQYMQEHNKKLAYRRNDQNNSGERENEEDKHKEPGEAPVVPHKKDVVPKKHKVIQVPETLPSVVTPSAIIRVKRTKMVPSSSIISSGSSVRDGECNEDDYPPQPKPKNGMRYQPCAICATPLEASTLTRRAWRAHVDQDIEPYVCISEDCIEPPQYFGRLQGWMDHMQTRHSIDWSEQIHTERWYCDVNHNEPSIDPPEFDERAEFLNHLNTCHGQQLTQSKILGRLRRNRRIATRDPFVCPLCGCIPPEVEKRKEEKPYKLLWEHIGQHLKSLAFLSLSYVEDDLEDRESIAEFSTKASHEDDAGISRSSLGDSSHLLYCDRSSCDCGGREKNATSDWTSFDSTFRSTVEIPESQLPTSHDDPTYSLSTTVQSEWEFWYPFSLPPDRKRLGPPEYHGHAQDEKLMEYFQIQPTRFAESDQELKSTLEWLTSVDYTSKQSHYVSKRHEGSGRWFLSSREFHDWVDTRRGTLFCPGLPAAGKTMLASIVIDSLHTQFRTDNDVSIIYLYCDYRRKDEQTAEDLLASLLKQLAQDRPSLPNHLRSLYDSHRSTGTRPSIDEISGALQSTAALYSRIFIIVDAVDECQIDGGCRAKLLAAILQLQGEYGVNFLATSRFIPEIVEMFEDSRSLEISASAEDIPSDFREYDRTYEDTMQRIEQQSPDATKIAKQALSWIICAERPLTTLELQHALAVELGRSSLDEENLVEVRDILSACNGLVAIDEETRIIRLAHLTMLDYFERTRMHWFPNAEADITAICVTYLSFSVFGGGRCGEWKDYYLQLRSNPLYDYAARNWGHHARKASTSSQVVMDFLKDRAKVEASCEVLADAEYGPNPEFIPEGLADMIGLDLAAYFGVETVVRLLCRSQGHDSVKLHDAKPLKWAAVNGHMVVVQLLLDEGADVNEKDTSGWTPLLYAARGGHETAIGLLLAASDVSEESKDRYEGVLLLWSAEKGNEDVAKHLLDKGADTELKDSGVFTSGQTPLTRAAQGGHEAVVRLLLKQGAVIEAKDNYGRTPLSYAAQEGHEAVVRLLLEQGAAIEAKDNYGRTPLSYAAEEGHEAVVRLLLEQGAAIEAKDNYGLTPLLYAAQEGHEAVIRLLLEQGAAIEAKDNYGRTPLSWAVRQGHEAVVRLLLEQGAAIEAKDKSGRTPLSWAAQRGHEAVVRLLLEQGAAIEAKDKSGRTPLSYAAEEGHEAVVRLLLEQGAAIETKDNSGQTPLSWAAQRGHEAVVKLLST